MGLKLAWRTWGEGTRTLVLLHGFTGSGASFDGLRPLLGDALRAVAVDLPGHGDSPLPERRGREGFLETLEALEALVDGLGAGPVDLLGYSQGARVALGAALRSPARFSRLILESGSPGLHRRQERAARREADGRLALLLREQGLEAFVQHWEALPLFESQRRLAVEVQEAQRARRLACSAQGLAGALECLGTGVQPDYWPHLHRLRLPTLLLSGALDRKFTEIAHRMAAELPVVWRHALEDCGHAPHLEAPARYAQEVRSFLETPWYEAPPFEVLPLPLGGSR